MLIFRSGSAQSHHRRKSKQPHLHVHVNLHAHANLREYWSSQTQPAPARSSRTQPVPIRFNQEEPSTHRLIETEMYGDQGGAYKNDGGKACQRKNIWSCMYQKRRKPLMKFPLVNRASRSMLRQVSKNGHFAWEVCVFSGPFLERFLEPFWGRFW